MSLSIYCKYSAQYELHLHEKESQLVPIYHGEPLYREEVDDLFPWFLIQPSPPFNDGFSLPYTVGACWDSGYTRSRMRHTQPQRLSRPEYQLYGYIVEMDK